MTVPTKVQTQHFLRLTAWMFLLGWGLHVIDHLLRGMTASPMFVMAGGMIQGVIVIVAITMALRAQSRAPDLAILTGVGSAVVFTYAHLLPNFWPNFQDSYLTGPRINVTWFSWVTALSEIGTGLLFAYAGLRAKRTAA
ncbi:hypothetical protein [Mycolicibacterium fortuitum]|uniref:Uncharacterized protein n=3 Tax=Mycolicibacterium fortuitum TaxID=1766 RepID=A0AAE5AG81_MYCFO|nr:hypothetical protein [Mycolicibacterium fortuitum]AMD54971.1 hypothetical protein ATO49_15105 [Mycolicibacterium fortuitum subsp. fortuitum DSM 46621 = ATCC 6841 = JCM 6387]MCA4725674.1 hypothetical protein [Mycolicibacterium fortuitum]MCA4753644.1 hypothetical protein [Mycolicibacterium fortuitum]MCV7138903.1 hypothetical protein [Mycolicibacterium fortuitum]MDG5771990.1 hypothetical protein [Mycolicibacterium fortuitum]